MELGQNDEITKLIMNSALDAIICMDDEGSITLWTKQAEKIFGWMEDEVKGKQLSDIIIPMRYRERHKVGLKHYVKSGKNKVLNRAIEIEGLHRSGNEFPIELTIVPIKRGENEFFCAFLRDISERKAAEEQTLKERTLSDALINGLPGVFYLYNKGGKFLRWNKNLETVTGYTDGEISAMNPLDFFDPDEKEILTDKIRSVFIKGQDEVEADFITKEGKKIRYYLNGWKINYEGEDCLLGVGIDISTRIKAEEESLKSELRYRSLINQASDAIFIADLQGNFTDVNESLCALTGYSKEELLKMNAAEFVEPAHLKEKPIPYERFKGGEHIFNERRVVLRNGSVIDMEVNSKKIGDSHILGIARDITERKKANEQLVKSEQKYRSLIEQASDPIMITDFKGNFIDVNTSLCQIFGYSKSELLKLNIAALIDPENLKEQPIKFELLATGQHVFSQRRMMKRDGSFIEVEANVKKVDENYVMAIVRDVTELRKVEREIKISEARFRGAFEYSAIGMAITTLEGKWMKVNHELCRITGYSEKELLDLSFKEITHPDDLPNDNRNVEKMLTGKIDSYRSEKRYIHKSGDIVWGNLAVSVVRDPHGIPLYFVAQIENISERKKAEEEIRQSQNTLRELSAHLQTVREEERTSIAREIHDELGQQLTGLKMDLSSLKKKIPSENKDAHKKTVSMMSLLDVTMKTVRHISSELRPGILDDLGLIDAINWQGIEFEKRTGVRCQFKSKLRNRSFDKEFSTGIFRVFQETLTNVARHAKATKVNTTLESDRKNIILKVQDNGKGFDSDEVKKKKTLGLVGMKERGITLGGKISIESAKGKGTTVILQVPLKLSKSKTNSAK
jgi:two-component system sensor histidine kinase UhpB